MQTRTQALLDLLECSAPMPQLVQALKQFPWDSDEELVILTPAHIRKVLLHYMNHELTEGEIEDWANAIEGREDIAFEEAHEGLLGECIHQLANPLLTEPLTQSAASRMLVLLG